MLLDELEPVRKVRGKGRSTMSELAVESTNAPIETGGPEGMINITALAAAKVNEIRQAEGIEGGLGLRLRVVGGGCAGFSYDLYFDESTEGERRVIANGVEVSIDHT